MVSKYPLQVDGYAEIRLVVDRRSEIVAGDHNDLRSAVISIERTLGINPQGPFGTVVARLNDAYSNIEAHVLGNPPRHQDSVIMSPLRTGMLPPGPPLIIPPYSLPGGALAQQITGILGFLNDSLMYAGSGATTFADGSDLVFSLIRDAITQIVSQLGSGVAGTQKISGDTLSAVNFPNIPSGTLRSQLEGLLDLIDAFGGTTGAGRVGATGFATSTGNKYTFLGATVQSQIEEAGAFLDEGASFREKAFNSFVASGMAVTNDGYGDALIDPGFIAANGRMVKYNGGGIVIPNGVTSYVYAEVINGTVGIFNSLGIPTRPLNPVVLLHKIERSGIAWTTSVDLRRYGMFSNDKNYISVGKTPVGGRDGYGCDFLSLKSAVDYVKILSGGGALIPPFKIILVSNLTITSPDEMEILLDIAGFEIDGCGRKITTDQDLILFRAEANNLTIKDLTLESNLPGAGSTLCLARVGYGTTVTNVTNFTVTNCKLLTAGADACPYFLRLSNVGGTTTVSNSVISNNIADVAISGVDYVTAFSTKPVLQNSVVTGNNIYQSIFAISSGYGIKASQQCVVSNNIISGGFDTGIYLVSPIQCCIDGNIIIGYDSAIVYMKNGIVISDDVDVDSGCVISNNIIKGIFEHGINCKAGSVGGEFISVFGNFIDNFHSITVQPPNVVAIKGVDNKETWVMGNKITAPGDYAILNCSHVIGNQIYGSGAIATTVSAITAPTSITTFIVNNTINDVDGYGIDVAGNSGAIISNNMLVGNASVAAAIYNVGASSVVTNNRIYHYGSPAGPSSSAIYVVSGDNTLISSNHINDTFGTGIYCNEGSKYLIANNIINISGGVGITLNEAPHSLVVNNYLYQTDNGFDVGNSSDNTTLMGNYTYQTQDSFAYQVESSDFCALVGNRSIEDPSNSIVVTSASDIQIENNYIYNCGLDAIQTTARRSVVCGNYIYDAGDDGIYVGGTATDSIISNNYIRGSSSYSIRALSGAHRLLIQGNLIKSSLNNSINLEQNNSCNIVGNHIYNPIGNGICLEGDSNNTSISSNWIYDSDAYGVCISSSSEKCLINGNLIRDASYSGIYVAPDGYYSTVSGNLVSHCCTVFGSTPQIDLRETWSFTCVGNNIMDPGNVFAKGIDMSNSHRGLCVGNRAVSNSALIFAIDYTGATNYLIEGNMANGGANPGGFAGLPVLGTFNGFI